MKKILIGLAGLIILTGLMIAGYAAFLFKTLPNPEIFDERQIAQSTKIYDRTGEILLYELYGEQKRTVVPFDRIPELVKKATLAIEDQNFYKHGGVDWRAVFRATLANLRSGRVVQGGSTITQQLAKNVFLKPERTLVRKIKELVLAWRLEQKYNKDEILELYLNQIPYGSNAYGIEAAAQTYFNKSARDLEPQEIALLVSLPKAPSYYSPWGAHRDELLTRKDFVLDQLQLAADKDKEIPLAPPAVRIKAPHFVIAVQDYLINQYGEDYVRGAGLKVTTTLDWPLQELAEKVAADGASRNTELYQGTNAALVAEDGKTGQVLAMVGSRNYFDTEIDGNFNVATQGLRQPGSAIKPFAYLTAFSKGYTPETVLFDLETEFDTTEKPEKSYKPQNFDEKFRGPVTMRQGLAQSINIPSVKTLYLAGLDETLAAVKKMGITTLTEKSRYGLSLALGGGEVKLAELVSAYSIFSQDGVRRRQSIILQVMDSQGKIIEEFKDQPEPVVEPQLVRLINDILSDTQARSPLFQNSLALTIFPNQEVALKTGTTDDYRDAWAIGYTPSLVAGVWAGNNDNAPMQRRGGSILAAVPIWSAFMNEVLKNYSQETFLRPEIILTDKPALNGQYLVNNEIHEILYHVSKNNPQGAAPADPKKDPQFENWEKPVLEWARENAGLISPTGPGGPISIEIVSPQSGQFLVSGNLNIDTIIKTQNELIKMEIYLNNQLIEQKSSGLGREVHYQNTIAAPLENQNKLLIKAFDSSNNSQTKEVIFFFRS